ncbi:MAG TPA: class I SAM-dependent methyltransferase [Myxococcaceae bacterium]|nr:class I SAM-dependent methyltransferase [Myxococcaceae bacterium]
MRGFEQIPWLYDAGMALYEALGLRRWRRWLVSGARGRVLEVGCGTGRNLPLYPEGTRVIGVDVSPDVLRAARARAPTVPLVRASAEALPFRDGSFDVAVSGLVFCSVPDPARGLAEVRRVLVPGGTLRMLEHVRSLNPLGRKAQALVAPIWLRLSGGCHLERDTEANVEAAGFTVEERRAKGTMRRLSARKG